MEPSHDLWKLIGGAVALIISMGTIYKMYVASLRNKQDTKELGKRCDAAERDVVLLKDRLDRLEKKSDKQDAAIEKIADRVYDQK